MGPFFCGLYGLKRSWAELQGCFAGFMGQHKLPSLSPHTAA